MLLTSHHIQTSLPTLHLYDKCGLALQLMNDYDVLHLPVVQEDKYVGLISKEDVADAFENDVIAVVQDHLINQFVLADEFIAAALKKVTHHQLSLIAVINKQQEVLGVILASQLLAFTSSFLGAENNNGVIVLEIEKRNFSFGEINRLVETNDAFITQLNSFTEAETGLLLVTIQINKPEISDIVSTFQRYDYMVRYYFGQEDYTNQLKENYSHLMNYLNI